MSLNIEVTTTQRLALNLVEQIESGLTNAGSVTNQEMRTLRLGMLGTIPADLMPDYPMSIATRTDPYTDLLEVIGWASVTQWDRVLCLQAFVATKFRSMGLATALASALVADGQLSQEMPLGVFSDDIVRIAKRLRFQQVIRYRRVDDGWVRSERLFDDPITEGLEQR